MATDTRRYTKANLALWEASAPYHASGAQWQKLLADAAKPGFSELDTCLTETLLSLNLAGKRAAQICCNNARELLSLHSLGIEPVLGIDQSSAFLSQGAQLAQASGQDIRLVEANVYDLPADLGTYDLVLITIGVLNWMPDLPAFFRVLSSLLASEGTLVIYETHPYLEMFEPQADTPFDLAYSYFDKDAIDVPEVIVYDGSVDKDSGVVGYWFVHTLGEIVTAAINAGLTVKRLEEHPHSNREPDYDKYEGQEAQLPMCYTLVAKKP